MHSDSYTSSPASGAMQLVPEPAQVQAAPHAALSAEALDARIQHYRTLVDEELRRLAVRLPRSVDLDELEADGLSGLATAAAQFDPGRGVEFATYAQRRIRGAMLDRLRALDSAPRSAREAGKILARARQEFLYREGREPGRDEWAAEACVESEEFTRLERAAALGRSRSLDAAAPGAGGADGVEGAGAAWADRLADPRQSNPLEQLAASETKAKLVSALKALPDRERAVVVLHYQQGLRLKEIALAMEVSEGRVSQLHNRALQRMREFMGVEAGGSAPEATSSKERTVHSAVPAKSAEQDEAAEEPGRIINTTDVQALDAHKDGAETESKVHGNQG